MKLLDTVRKMLYGVRGVQSTLCALEKWLWDAKRSPAHNLKQHSSTASTEVKGNAEVIVPLSPEMSRKQSDNGTASSVIALF
ncbi:hypothetical protein [Paenibacillus radicis (ex Xue et al. 2023)]|uniref:Uncharacterized protein n=1 Tax=Paenibacillus radicis (ex Xue et al. 2023) TaxID=2972489 RepID=A0ABT1YPH1_9BACL|nr:hypothetical protein [Paenibacillus radicis (ex Xue et al. 2023)]MCR8635074.1 hypothetical protein [Paenibacillus radicis (ex Xue et al. 2023)]